MPKIFTRIWDLLVVLGQARAASTLARQGRYKEAQTLMQGEETMMTIREMWERLQETLNPDTQTEFERWVINRNPQDASELEQLEREWFRTKQFTQAY